MLHSSYLLYSAVVRAIEHALPSIGQYLDARLVESKELSSDLEFLHLCIKDEKYVLDQTVSFSEFSIWENKAMIRDKLFTANGFVRPLSLSYFDIPSINDRSVKSNEIFEALSETENLAIFNSISVNIIIEKAWHEHRAVFVYLFVAPYCLLLGTFFYWSNFCSFYNFERAGFNSADDQKRAGIVCFAIIATTCLYFLAQEAYQVWSDPKLYFKSSWNLFDVISIFMCLISPTYYIVNMAQCSKILNDDAPLCVNGIPGKNSNLIEF